MLFDFDRYRSRVVSRQMAASPLEQKQRDVYDSHRHRVFSVSFYMTGSELQAEEILEEVFIRAFRRCEEPNHAVVDAALVEQLGEHMVLGDTNLPVPRIDALPADRNIFRPDLEEAIRALPPFERLVFLLMDVEGYSTSRVAPLVGKSEGEILRASIRARMRLRAELAALRADGEQAA